MTFKLGDWVLYEFDLGQVTSIERGHIVGFSTTYFNVGGNNMEERMFPLTMDYLRIAQGFKHEMERLHREGSSGLNYPEIHNWVAALCVEACRHVENQPLLDEDWKKLNAFVRDVLQKQRVDSGYGFALMRGGR